MFSSFFLKLQIFFSPFFHFIFFFHVFVSVVVVFIFRSKGLTRPPQEHPSQWTTSSSSPPLGQQVRWNFEGVKPQSRGSDLWISPQELEGTEGIGGEAAEEAAFPSPAAAALPLSSRALAAVPAS